MADSSFLGEEEDPYGLHRFKIKGIGHFVGKEQDPDGHEREVYLPDQDEWPSKITLFDNQGRPIRG